MEGGTTGDPSFDLSHSAVCVKRVVCSRAELLSDIGVPSIISQKTRNIGSKLVKYWPTSKTLKIHYTDAGPMQPICRFQILLSRRPDRAQSRNFA